MKATVVHHLIQATSASVFLHTDGPHQGKVIRNMPFWIKIGNDWWFDFMREDMDKETFRKNLQAGAVYYLDKVTSK